ncbi:MULTISPECIES: hypothetical protein [Cupriavidus]
MNQTSRTKTAVIPAIAHAPARDAHVSLAHQWAVDVGIATADDALSQLGTIPLHVFVPGCAARFQDVVQQAAADVGRVVSAADLRAFVDAYVAGLLGRLQQYLLAGLADPAHAAGRVAARLH